MSIRTLSSKELSLRPATCPLPRQRAYPRVRYLLVPWGWAPRSVDPLGTKLRACKEVASAPVHLWSWTASPPLTLSAPQRPARGQGVVAAPRARASRVLKRRRTDSPARPRDPVVLLGAPQLSAAVRNAVHHRPYDHGRQVTAYTLAHTASDRATVRLRQGTYLEGPRS
jgi:hypothetical protein